MKQSSRIIAAFAVFVFTAWGQIGTGTITGRIIDGTGAVVPGAAVTVVAEATNFTFKTTSNTDGLYRVLSLSPGKYRVTMEAQGFKKTTQEIELRTGDTLAVDAALQVGSLTESIEVSSAATLLETETSATGSVVAGSVLYDMPLYQRYINSTMNIV
ncbi:MAG: carboxypeptidase-like regulatory domain-containing protein, partial [Acidobacteriota bacterium]